MFVASLVMEKKPAAGAPVVGSTLIDSLRLGGTILATLGLVAMLILNAASGGFLGDVSGVSSAL
jgi:hypothetical protein